MDRYSFHVTSEQAATIYAEKLKGAKDLLVDGSVYMMNQITGIIRDKLVENSYIEELKTKYLLENYKDEGLKFTEEFKKKKKVIKEFEEQRLPIIKNKIVIQQSKNINNLLLTKTK